MRISDGGEIGIGTSGCKATLDIKPDNNSWEGGILLQHDNATTGWNIHPERQGSGLWFGYNANTSAALTDQTASERVIFASNGNVGIGDTDPPSTLTVIGNNTTDVAQSNGAGINGLALELRTAGGRWTSMYVHD